MGEACTTGRRLYPVRGVVLDQELDRESAERSHGKTQNFCIPQNLKCRPGNEFRALF